MGNKKRNCDKNFFTDALHNRGENRRGEVRVSWRSAFKQFWEKRGIDEGMPYQGKISYGRRDTAGI